MPKLIRKTAVLAKIESTYGVDPTPTGAANAILLRNISVNPIAATVVSRDLIRSYLGNSDQQIADNHVEMSFEIEMAGSGALGTAPAYGVLLRACGLAETITASTKVEYTPISTGFESVTIYINVDGVQHKLTGARGSVSMEINVRQIPVFKFSFVGVYNTVADVTPPTPVYTAFQNPLAVSNTNTTAFTFFGETLNLEQFSLDANNTVEFRALVGAEYVQISDRQSNGQVLFELTSVADFDVFGLALGTTNGAISITHGTATGNKVKIDCAKVDIGQPTYAESQGIQMVQCPFLAMPTSGNDDFKITIL